MHATIEGSDNKCSDAGVLIPSDVCTMDMESSTVTF
jgi:hypothetical protein